MARKEMHVFGSDLRFGVRFYRRDQATYLAEFESRNGHRLAGEASVWYLFSTQAASEINDFNPDSKIIIMLREPVEMLYSMYCQFRYEANEHLPTFAAALAAEDERHAGRQINRHTYFPQGLLYRQTARYVDQVQRYLDAFGPERVHVIIYDDLASEPASVYRKTLEFLGVDPSSGEKDFKVVNANKNIRSRAFQAVLSEPLLRSAALSVGLGLPRPLFHMLGKAETKLWRLNTRSEPRPPLSPGLRAQLKREFAPEVERLSRLLGRDLTHWSK